MAELLRGDVEEEGAVRWPDGLAPALATAGFRTELREFLLRATERGVGPGSCAAWGRELGHEPWAHAAAFQEQYEAVTAFSTAGRGRGVRLRPGRAGPRRRSPSSTATRAAPPGARARPLAVRRRVPGHRPGAGRAAGPARRGRRRPGRGRRPRPGDLRVPRRRAARHRRLPRALPARRRPAGPPGLARRVPPVRRGAAADQPAGRRRAARPVGAPPAASRSRAPTPAAAEVHVFGSAAVEAAYLADVLRRAHLLDGVPWSQMAVVVRTAGALGPLRRALASAGVPVAVSADDLPLAAQPAVAPAAARADRAAARRPRRRRRPAPVRPRRAGARRRCWPPRWAARRCSTCAGCAGRSASRFAAAGHRRRRARRAAGHGAGRRGAARGAARARRPAGPAGGRRAGRRPGGAGRRTAPPRTCCGRCGSAAAWPSRWARASAAGGPVGRRRRPRPRRRGRAVRRRRRVRRPAAVRRRPGVRRPPGRPGAARRHRRGPRGRRARRSGC